MQYANILLAAMFALCKLPNMNTEEIYAALIQIGVSRSYASQIANGHREPPLELSLKLFKICGLKIGKLSNAFEADIDAIIRVLGMPSEPPNSHITDHTGAAA